MVSETKNLGHLEDLGLFHITESSYKGLDGGVPKIANR